MQRFNQVEQNRRINLTFDGGISVEVGYDTVDKYCPYSPTNWACVHVILALNIRLTDASIIASEGHEQFCYSSIPSTM